MNYKPETDGIDHINIYSKGKTILGRFLSNFANTPIETEDGKFASIEGYWYWLGTDHPLKDNLRRLHGFKAKELGRQYRGLDWQDSEEFKQKICKAINIKLNTYPEFLKELKESILPLTHYYDMYGKIIVPKDGQWIIDYINSFRK